MIKQLSDLVGLENIPICFHKDLNKAIFEDTGNFNENTPTKGKKTTYKPVATLINPLQCKDMFEDFVAFALGLNSEISAHYLQVGISFKVRHLKIEKNVFSIRHPYLNPQKDNVLRFALTFSCVLNDNDWEYLDLDPPAKKGNYEIRPLTFESAKDILTPERIRKMVVLANRSLSRFKSRKNVI